MCGSMMCLAQGWVGSLGKVVARLSTGDHAQTDFKAAARHAAERPRAGLKVITDLSIGDHAQANSRL